MASRDDSIYKPVDSLSEEDLKNFSVWEFVSDDTIAGVDETWVKPVTIVPVNDLSGKVVSTEVTFCGGARKGAIISNIDVDDQFKTILFMNISIMEGGCWFHLARYFDFDYKENGPDGLACFLGMKVGEIFPIYYNIKEFCSIESSSLSGLIKKEPDIKLLENDIVKYLL